MFHALCRNCADALVGRTKANRSDSAWRQAYRAAEHKRAKDQCKKSAVMDKFPTEIQDFANKFVELQEMRHKADYDPSFSLTRHDVITEIEAAETAIKKLQKPRIKDRRAFAVWTVMNFRSERRTTLMQNVKTSN